MDRRLNVDAARSDELIESRGPMWSIVNPAASRAIWTLCLPRKWLAPNAKKYPSGCLRSLIILTTHCSFLLMRSESSSWRYSSFNQSFLIGLCSRFGQSAADLLERASVISSSYRPCSAPSLYRVVHLVGQLGWVDFDLGRSTICLVLLWRMGSWQNLLSKWPISQI